MAVEELKLSQDQDLNSADALNVAGPARNQKKNKAADSLGTLVSPAICRQSLADGVEVDSDNQQPTGNSGPSLGLDFEPDSKSVLEDVADGLHGLFISVADGIKNMERKIFDALGGEEIEPGKVIAPVEPPKTKKRKKLRKGELEETPERPIEPPLPE